MAARRRVEAMVGAGHPVESSVRLTIAQVADYDMWAEEPGTAPRCFRPARFTAFSGCRAAIPVGGRRPKGGGAMAMGIGRGGPWTQRGSLVASAVIGPVAIS